MQGKIDATKEKINALTAKVKTSEQAAARIASSKSQIQVPAGTLAEIDAQITSLDAELKEAQENLTTIRLEEQKAADAQKAKEEADRKEKERIEAEEKAKTSAVSCEAVQASMAERPGEMGKKADALFGPEKVGGASNGTLLPGHFILPERSQPDSDFSNPRGQATTGRGSGINPDHHRRHGRGRLRDMCG